MRTLGITAARLLTVLLIGGFLSATLVRFAPGFGTDEQELDSRLSSASIAAIRQSHAGNPSLPSYYLHYLERLAHGDLGYSVTLQQPVRVLLAERFPETLRTVALGLALSWLFGLSLAVAPLLLRNRSLDLFSSLLAGVLLCLPAAVLALLFVIAHAPARLVLALIIFPKVFSYARSMVRQSAGRPHVISAWAKGLGSCRVFFHHVLPVAGPQLLALAGVSVSLAFAAAVPVEVVCDLPGIGQLAWKAALGRDLELLMNLTLIVTAVTLLANSTADFINTRSANDLHAGAA